MRKIYSIVFVASMVLAACSNDDDPTPVLAGASVNSSEASDASGRSSSHAEKFLAGKSSKDWHAIKYFIGGVDYTFLFQECSLDNIQTFTLDGRYIEIEGATKCDPSAPDIFDQGTFTFNDDYTHFYLNATHLQVDFTVVELKPNSFKLKYFDPSFGEIEFWLVPVKNNWDI